MDFRKTMLLNAFGGHLDKCKPGVELVINTQKIRP